jgi:hypothetical protein
LDGGESNTASYSSSWRHTSIGELSGEVRLSEPAPRNLEPHRSNARQGHCVDQRIVANVKDQLHLVAGGNASSPLGGQVDALLQAQARPLPGGALQQGDVVALCYLLQSD